MIGPLAARRRRALPRVLLTGCAVLTGCTVLVGCATVPTRGPVEQVTPPAHQRVERGVQVRPVTPQPDAAPDVVLAGFLDAMASLEPGFVAARQYLTPAAAKAWDPGAGVTVFDGDTRSSLPGSTTAGLQARVVGTLDAEGHYTASTGTMLSRFFTMQQVDGQWRISNPPDGLLVSQYTLLHRFTPTSVWFHAAGGRTLVPERVWLASNPSSPVEAVQALLRGPSEWLAPAVTSAIPAGTRLTVPAVGVTAGVAEVPLDHRIAELPSQQRSQLVAQLGSTLRAFPEVRAVRVLCDGDPWPVPGQEAGGEVLLENLPGISPVPLDGDEQPFAIKDGAVGRLDDQGAFSALSGSLGTKEWGDRPAALAVSSSNPTVAVVNAARTRLLTTRLGRDQLAVRLTGKGIGRPVVTATGQVWVGVDGDAATALHTALGASRLAPVSVPALAGAKLVAFALSPDQTRMAVVLRRGEASELGVLRVSGMRADGYRRLPLDLGQASLESVVDVGWTGPEQLMVLGSQHDARASAWLVSADGSQVEAVGPAGDLDLVSLSTRPHAQGAVALLRARSGEVLRYESAWRWQILPHRMDVVCIPS